MDHRNGRWQISEKSQPDSGLQGPGDGGGGPLVNVIERLMRVWR